MYRLVGVTLEFIFKYQIHPGHLNGGDGDFTVFKMTHGCCPNYVQKYQHTGFDGGHNKVLKIIFQITNYSASGSLPVIQPRQYGVT
jgi:hypothetical protein